MIEVGAFVDMGEEPFNPAVLCGRNLTLIGMAGEDLLTTTGRWRCWLATSARSRSPRWSLTASRSRDAAEAMASRSTPTLREGADRAVSVRIAPERFPGPPLGPGEALVRMELSGKVLVAP